ncbi:MAG: M14 family zinc carboxypeptidase [Vicinamibacterales bacterium]
MTRMRRVSRSLAVVSALLCSALGLIAAARQTPVTSPTPQALASIWDAEHVSPPLPPLLDHDEVERRMRAAGAQDPSLFHFERVGQSLEGRSIDMITVGHGPFGVLLWSQMHGDEPTATAALFDVLEYLHRHAADASVQQLLSSLTLYIVPMLNPDGAERYQRRNAQGIDINRDALRLQTPEGAVLKALRDRLKPQLGFNLHNENWGTSVGDPPKPATISLLAVAYDKAHAVDPTRQLITKKLCAVIREALEPFIPGQIGRYDEDFEVRAFGDNLTLWGTPVVLIETGPYQSPEPDPPTVRLNFIGIMSALDALATGSVEHADPDRYDSLPRNQPNRELYVLVNDATVLTGTGVPPFTADIGISAVRRVRVVNGARQIELDAKISDLGDLRTDGALRTIDATGLVAAPLWNADLHAGQDVQLPEWSKAPSPVTIAPGQPGELVLLRPEGDPSAPAAHFVVETVLKY